MMPPQSILLDDQTLKHLRVVDPHDYRILWNDSYKGLMHFRLISHQSLLDLLLGFLLVQLHPCLAVIGLEVLSPKSYK